MIKETNKLCFSIVVLMVMVSISEISHSSSQSIKRKNRNLFTSEEDNKLRAIVTKHGPHKWESIAKNMPGRTSKQCRDRYQNYLSPKISKNQWTREEDDLLLTVHEYCGNNWSEIARFFPGRTGMHIKNRFHLLQNRKNVIINQLKIIIPQSGHDTYFHNTENINYLPSITENFGIQPSDNLDQFLQTMIDRTSISNILTNINIQ